MNVTNLIFSGVGGQGVLLAAETTARAALREGLDVKQTEVHGVSQRGGSVESHVRYGGRVHSPLVRPGEADVVFALEKLEGLRFAHFIRPNGGPRPGGILLVNDHEIVPASVAGATEHYPHHALSFLSDKGVRVIALPASQQARDLGDGRIANVVLLGGLSVILGLPEAVWLELLQEKLPAKHREVNLRAFQWGRNALLSEGVSLTR